MAFEISGAVLAEGIASTVATDAAFELMPLAMESLAPEALGALAPETFAGFGGETLASLFGSEAVPGVVQQAVAPAAQGVLEGGVGAGEGITAATPHAIETGAALPEATTPFAQGAPQFSPEELNAINQGTMDAASSGPSPYAPEASLNQTQLVPNTPVETPPTGTENLGQGLKPNMPGPGTQTISPGTLSGPTQPYGISPGTAPGGGLSGGPLGTGVNPSLANLTPTAPDTGFMEGFNNFVDKHPFMTGAGIYGIASATGALNHGTQSFNASQLQGQQAFNNPYKFSSSFQGSHPNPQQYQVNYSGYPGYKGYADGGITQAAPLSGTPAANTMMDSTIGNNTMFPMSEMDRSYYATPTQLPAGINNARTPQTPQTPQSMAGTTGGYEAKVDPYTGTMGMAAGGIARYYRGELATSTGGKGDVYGATSRFLDMADPASRYEAPSGTSDVGIFHDTNPSTRDKSAYQAAALRQKAIANKAGIKTSANYVPPTRQMGQLNLAPANAKADNDSDSDQVLAASGGIMGANLGGYAAGGNPRLLRGPGDGMSDNIPATIGGRQPARLADGEFVVPADVVSHLGNGSTDAGAKRLHEMMNKVRMDRTGKKKQAPEVKADKYIPK
jgi:hypothetical protein